MTKLDRKILLLLFFISNVAMGNTIIEDFADGDITNNPQWVGDTASMTVKRGELRVKTADKDGYSWIATNSTTLKDGGTWMGWFWIGTTPTKSNYALFVLSSETMDMTAPKGYFVKIGGTAKNVCLLSNGGANLNTDNSTLKVLIKSEDGRVNNSTVRIFVKVSRDSVGNWKLETKKEGESEYRNEGNAFDTTYTNSSWAGIGLGYSQSKYASIGADNIRIFEKDTLQDTDDLPSNLDSVITEDDFDTESTLKINEVMPNNTKDETEEYIELINTTTREISLWQTWLAVRRKDGSIGTKYYFPYKMNHLFDRPKVRYVEPNGIVCVSSAPELDSSYYMSRADSKFIAMDMPELNNNGACIVIGSDDNTVHDEFCYDKSMFGELIKNYKNVALERVSANKPTMDRDNWKVASSIVNYGTPGYDNSQTNRTETDEGNKKTGFWTEYDNFSPNNDGYNDVALINYSTGHDDYSANIRIYDMKGKVVRTLYNNIMLSSEGTIEWDGIDDHGSKVDSGMYLIMCEMLSPRGKKIKAFKLPIAATAE